MDKQTGLNLISLIRQVLKNEKPSVYEKYDEIYKMAKFHHLTGITYLGVKDIKDISCYEEWKKSYDMTCLRNIYFEVERESIFNEMKKAGLAYMPLKGINLLSCYPDYGMRMMSDNDIFYGFVEKKENIYYINRNREKEAQSVLINIMESLGYEIGSLKGKDDVFYKEPIYNFEMHRSLVSRGDSHYEYYINPLKYSNKDKNDDFLYYLSVEEEYIYNIVHAYNHCEYAGIGIRYLIDMYVYLEKYESVLDFDYVSKKIKELKIEKFYKKSYKLCMDAFKYEMDDEDKEFLFFLLSCGIYGTYQQQMDNRLKGNSKFSYVIKRLYPTSLNYQDQYPLFYKYKILFLFLPAYRLLFALINHPKRIVKEIKRLIRI